jgi:hypothetical protein
MDAIDNLINQWQNSIDHVQPEMEDPTAEEEWKQLYEVTGMHIRSGVVAGQLFSLLTICRCED